MTPRGGQRQQARVARLSCATPSGTVTASAGDALAGDAGRPPDRIFEERER